MVAGRRYLILGLLGRGFLWSLVGLQWLLGHLPRRVPDLARLTRDADFGRLHSVWADWLDQNLGLIESGAPWLDRTGSWVFDRCYTSAPATRIPVASRLGEPGRLAKGRTEYSVGRH